MTSLIEVHGDRQVPDGICTISQLLVASSEQEVDVGVVGRGILEVK